MRIEDLEIGRKYCHIVDNDIVVAFMGFDEYSNVILVPKGDHPYVIHEEYIESIDGSRIYSSIVLTNSTFLRMFKSYLIEEVRDALEDIDLGGLV